MLTFEQWLSAESHEPELWSFFLQIEKHIAAFRHQFDRRRLFLAVARQVYEYSVMTTQYHHVA